MSSNKRNRDRQREKQRKGYLRQGERAKATKTLNDLDSQRAVYAENWSKSDAAHCEASGYYRWMAKFVEGYPLVLEIGTGDGRGTLELARMGHTVVSIDENPLCLKMAFDRLKAAKINVELEDREAVQTLEQPELYQIEYAPPCHPRPLDGVLLLTGDVMADPALLGWLLEIGPFDAIVCWLIGTHNARSDNIAVAQRHIRSSGEYRLRVQNKTYDLAHQLLRSGGVLHIVDRGEAPTEENEAELTLDTVNAHRDQASTTCLQVDSHSVACIPFEKSSDDQGVRLEKTLGLSGRDPGTVPLALCSIIARKP